MTEPKEPDQTTMRTLPSAEASRAIRHWANEQALASTRLSGHEPSQEFILDYEAVVNGTMAESEARERSLQRARVRDEGVCSPSATRLEG